MSLISLSNVSYSLGDKILFDKLSFAINPAERTALVGLNGAGKSTLLNILSGELEADEGVVARRSGAVIEHVPQLMPRELWGVTLFDALSHKIPEGMRYDGNEYLIDQRLRAAGFQPKQYRQSLGTLSGGEANRALMARALMSEPDLVLLDEPTNHMDIKQVAAFERFVLEELHVAVLIVSHDRALLDAVTSHTLFLRDKRIYAFNLQFSEARKALRASDAAAVERRRSEERELDRLRESAKRLADWGKVYSNEKFSYRAKSMQKRIEKLEDQVTEVSQGRRGTVALDTITGNSGFVVEINDFVIRAPQGHSLSYIDRLAVRRGERLAVTGQNGCGKSTFIKARVAQL
jgi:ATPase subunit of ABC transporter with duplicated ATPase domains